ncbi:hypothetical protein DYB37_008462 [Aphanomyces astaci]|uniref:Uncharacterized protein n=2 Tax=Aphanomyces astaci TaxID=112090 RepID=A0A3R7C6E5_APHAT|nr:hypothetical protein DYB37_008462 [Aphanomyces astaci]
MSASVVELHGDVYIKFAPPGTSKRHSCKSCDKFTPSCVQCKKRRRKHKRQAAARRTSIWETASLNRTWEIPDEIKLQLPLVATGEAFTARHKFLSLCLDHELPPCLRLIIRSKVSPEINVSHMSMGDQLVQDDGEVVAFAKALCTNRTCHTLDLSRNVIGSNEALNVVQPDLVTGGEALAEMLATNGHLTVLNLSWNFLRLNSAVELGRALAQNNTLKELNLSYNAFGNDGAQAIGCALQRNICVESLDMSHNNIPSKAAFVIAQSLHHNDTLTSLAMDGNPLGRIG